MARSTANSASEAMRKGVLAPLIGLASFSLILAATVPALAQNAGSAPQDYAAKTCPPQPLSLDVPQPTDLQSIEEPMNVGEYKRKLTNYKCSGEYDKAVAEVLAKATDYVEQHASDAKQPALVLDIDETSLSNWPAILTDDYGFIVDGTCDMTIAGACGWRAWQLHAKDEAIAPTLALFNAAKAKGVAVFFVTGRCEIGPAREATEANLRAAGYAGWADLIMRPKDCPKLDTVVAFKASARGKIEEQGYKIVANVGDQWSDLNGGFAEKRFKVPNPFYFLP
jgi:predicted secreted acid phosphatase